MTFEEFSVKLLALRQEKLRLIDTTLVVDY